MCNIRLVWRTSLNRLIFLDFPSKVVVSDTSEILFRLLLSIALLLLLTRYWRDNRIFSSSLQNCGLLKERNFFCMPDESPVVQKVTSSSTYVTMWCNWSGCKVTVGGDWLTEVTTSGWGSFSEQRTVCLFFLMLHIVIPRSLQTGSWLHPNLWVQKKIVLFGQSA